MKPLPPLRAYLALLIAYVAAVLAAPSVDATPESSLATASPPGSRPTSSGGSIIYDSTHAANLDDPGAFAVHATGEFISVTPDLPATHSFTQPGTGDDAIERSNPFTYVDADDTPKDMHTEVEGIAKAKLSGDPDVPRQVHDKRSGLSKEPKFKYCSASGEQMIKDAVSDAHTALEGAIFGIDRDSGPGSIFERWFGDLIGTRQVRINLEEFKPQLDFSTYTFYCADGDPFPSEILLSRRMVIIREPFWRLMPGPKSAQILRMAGWHIRGMRTTALGPAASRRLAIDYGFDALWNLDNYVAFIRKEADPLAPPRPHHPPPYEPHEPSPHGPHRVPLYQPYHSSPHHPRPRPPHRPHDPPPYNPHNPPPYDPGAPPPPYDGQRAG